MHSRDAVIRPEEIRVKKSREYFKRLATIDERAKKKKKKENSTRSINEEKKVTSVLRSTWDPRSRDVIALIRIIKNAANYDAARTFSFRHARFHIAGYQREISH